MAKLAWPLVKAKIKLPPPHLWQLQQWLPLSKLPLPSKHLPPLWKKP